VRVWHSEAGSYNQRASFHTVKIYTRTGDSGDTSLLGGSRVSKSDPRVDAYGDVDETSACLGLALATLRGRADTGLFDEVAEALVQIQRDLLALGARLADPSGVVAVRLEKATVEDADVERLERLIDRLEADLPPLTHFILPGGVEAGAALHLGRAVCRRAERRIVRLKPPAEPVLLRYVNRLSDLLFVMARWVNHRAGAAEVKW
jgi:cob(I)alamin adenosyltransferase